MKNRKTRIVTFIIHTAVFIPFFLKFSKQMSYKAKDALTHGHFFTWQWVSVNKHICEAKTMSHTCICINWNHLEPKVRYVGFNWKWPRKWFWYYNCVHKCVLFCVHLPLDMFGHLFELTWHFILRKLIFFFTADALRWFEFNYTKSAIKASVYLHYNVIISPSKNMWFFIWANLKYLDPNIFFANVGYNCQLVLINKVRDWEREEGCLSPFSSLHNMGSFLFTKPGLSEWVVGNGMILNPSKKVKRRGDMVNPPFNEINKM